MDTHQMTTPQQTTLTRLEDLAQSAKHYASQSVAQNTKSAYMKDWEHFTQWAIENGQTNLPASPETIALYITALADQGFKVSTIKRRLVTLSQVHQLEGYNTPPTKDARVRAVLKGIKNIKGTAPEQKIAITTDNILDWVIKLDMENPTDVRDKAIILVGFASALRRSELVALDLENLEFVDQGFVVTLNKSKTNQEGDTEQIAIPNGKNVSTCPVTALNQWLEKAGIEHGAIFRSIRKGGNIQDTRLTDKSIALIVKRFCKDLGLSEKDCKEYSGHSLRAGHATQAIENNAPSLVTMSQTRHKSETVFKGYVRRGNLFRNNSAKYLGL